MKLRYRGYGWFAFVSFALLVLVVGLLQEIGFRSRRDALISEYQAVLRDDLLTLGHRLEERQQGSGLLLKDESVDFSGGGGVAYALLNAHGAVLAVPGREAIAAKEINAQGDGFLNLLGLAREKRELIAGWVGSSLVGIYPLRGNSETDTVLVAQRDLSSFLLDLDQNHFYDLAYLLTMLTIAVLLVFLFVYFLAVRRLSRLGLALQRFGEGDFASRSGLQGWDAIARLGQHFDQMAEVMAAERSHLAESEERLKFALRGSDIGIWDWHLESGATYYSPRWKSLLGYDEDELVAHAEEWLKRVHPEDLPAVMDRLKEHMAGQSEFFISEHRLRCKNGSYLWVLERGVVSRNVEGVAVRMVGALSDISRRKEIEAALLYSEEEYRSVVEGVTQIIFRSDVRGRLLFLNPAWTELTGFPVGESLSSSLADYIHVDDRQRVMTLFRDAAEGRLPALACDLRLRCGAGQERWFSLHARGGIDAGGEAIVAGVLSDLDAQKATEAALTRSNGERNAILSLSPDGFVLVDKDGRVAYVNPAFLAMTQFAPTEVLGLSLPLLEQKMGQLCDPVKALPASFGEQEGRAYTFHLQKPAKLVIRSLLRSIPNDMGGLHGQVMYFRDITQESEIDRIKSEFLSTAAHELRTPMASIFGFSELLLAREFDAATQRDLIQTIHRQTQNLINLVNELLDLARIEAQGGKAFKIQEQELSPLLLNALAGLYVPPETHRLELDLPKRLPRVIVDGEKLLQCLANVLSNAIKYSPRGGEIRISAMRRKAGPGEQVGLSIRDQGMGMTPEQLSHIFDRFYRADASGAIPGSGLGMSLVKEIMDIFNGEVAVNSQPGQGTEVVLWLPVALSLSVTMGEADEQS